ncbi:NAD(P)-dependent dehydrogenase (short-subunit alcohol dehydrogenase family) [Larkinella arboricola]|uniref:NAD(P)-dependent dehydrogenase (Short-subunit alcohol dehydrogenase family) n=2 Tax=Larkinella arboricola TaxID=643671 RepID=A0A327WT85_LARAB|nr:NAD(P)-dependent dehydrogenase (short-subunit alcohol dehydrogenase family) [Larkinella arboricola]
MLREDALKDKTIIVTGGGTGLGKSMARYFLQLGAHVVICSRKLPVLEATAAELMDETGGQVLPLACDVRNPQEIENVIAQTIERFGRIDGLLNNSAGNFISPTERLSYKAFDVVVDIVLRGTYYFTLAVGKYWINNNIPGTVLNISTTYATTGSGYVVPSAVAKGGALILVKSLAAEWAKYGIRLNAIAPGPFPTKGAWDRLFPEPLVQMLDPTSRIPLKRVGDHQELANLAAYLLSDYSAYMTGECITIDGGEVLSAGEFNHLDMIRPEQWDEIGKAIKQANKPDKE